MLTTKEEKQEFLKAYRKKVKKRREQERILRPKKAPEMVKDTEWEAPAQWLKRWFIVTKDERRFVIAGETKGQAVTQFTDGIIDKIKPI